MISTGCFLNNFIIGKSVLIRTIPTHKTNSHTTLEALIANNPNETNNSDSNSLLNALIITCPRAIVAGTKKNKRERCLKQINFE